jgi:hypothetical protein
MANYFKKQGEMKNIRYIQGVRLSATLLLFLLFSVNSSVAAADPATFSVFFSGNVFGELEACGG